MTTSDLFRRAFEAAVEKDPPALRAVRQSAYDRFQVLGLPTTREEQWKGTSLAPLGRATFGPPPATAKVTLDDLKPLSFGSLGRYRVVFVNGRLSPSLSTLDTLPQGVTIASYAKASAANAGVANPEAIGGMDAFAALNLALAGDGVVLGVSPHVVVEEPLYFYFYSTPGTDTPVIAVRNAILAVLHSQVTVVEAYGGAPGARYLTSASNQVTVGVGAVVDHVKLQRESVEAFHLARLGVTQERGSRFSNLSVNLGAALSRHDVDARFGGEGGECALDGLFMAAGEQHTDTHTRIDHAVPHCSSRQLYKGILDGRARGVFHGRVIVRKDAQKTDALQTNKNLLLSREALVNSTPQLEILADDVKCKHGSTTGQLDATALFYLRSRGISEAAAKSLLTYAFASDVVQRVPVAELRAGLEAHLQALLPGAQEPRESVA
jgi:Fe-S cluster assembly protein SufD